MDGWVIVKGLKQDQRHWLGFQTRLAERLGLPVLPLDLPGAGTEHERLPPGDVAAMADDLRRRWKAETGGGRWGLMGLSLGGMVVMSWAERHPDDVASVVVGNTSCAATSRPWQRMRPRGVAGMVRAATIQDPVARERIVLSLVSATVEGDRKEALANTYAAFQEARPFTRAALVRQVTAAGGFRSPTSLAPPVVVLRGYRDHLVDPGCGARLAHRLGVPLVTHPRAGHDLSLDAPDWLAEHIEAATRTAPLSPRGSGR